MARSTYSVSQAQGQLPSLLRLAEQGSVIGISRRDETVAYLVSREQFESLVETMELLANPEAQSAIAAHRKGKTKFVALSSLSDE
jgi:prevent-host-death family protein